MKCLIITPHTESTAGHGRFSYDLIKFLKKNNFKIVVLCNQINNELKGVKQLVVLPQRRSFKRTFFLSWLYLFKLLKYRKELKDCEFIHCAAEQYAFFAFLIGKFFRKKYFIQTHGSFGVYFFQYKLYGFLQKIAYKYAHKVICVSNYTKNRILKYKKFDNLVVIPNGVDLEKFQRKAGQDYPGKENFILSVGAFKERKGFDLVIKALAVIKERISDIKYYIVAGRGDEDYYKYLVQLVDDHKLGDNVVFYRNITDDELKNLYQKAKVFVLTPVSDEYNFEGFGLVYLEANAYGVPAVGSYDSGAEEAIRNGYSGFLAKAGDVNDIAENIIKLLSNKKLYDDMSKNAIRWAQKMSWENIIKDYIKIYKA